MAKLPVTLPCSGALKNRQVTSPRRKAPICTASSTITPAMTAWRARMTPPMSGRKAWSRKAAKPRLTVRLGQSAPALCPGTKSDRECPGLPACQQARHLRLRNQRGNRRPMLRCLELLRQRHRNRSIHHKPRLRQRGQKIGPLASVTENMPKRSIHRAVGITRWQKQLGYRLAVGPLGHSQGNIQQTPCVSFVPLDPECSRFILRQVARTCTATRFGACCFQGVCVEASAGHPSPTRGAYLEG